jgi:2',3'-cyclic-nucleotide 2'-phosphodiesterase (5'-nucleotidase family)
MRGSLALLALLALSVDAPVGASSGAPAAAAPAKQPTSAAADATSRPAAGGSTLVILSTTDVKGKSSPCGCHVPKGGLARRAAFADSVRAANPNLLVVDSGGFFPEEAGYETAAAFMMDAMKSLNVAAAGLGESDLRFGRAFLLAQLARTKLSVTCANLLEKASGRPLVAPYVLRQAGRAKVGLFGLVSDKADLGPSRDSLRAADPLETAERTVAALRAKGATVIVLLSELGKTESEEVANVIEGIDVVIAGHKMPLFANGRRIGRSLVIYGGEQSHYIGRTSLALDAAGRPASGDAATFMLGPEIPEQPAMLAAVRTFEDGFNAELERREKQLALQSIAGDEGDDDEPREHFVGAEVCARCHRAEFEQWRTTAHARAWTTLVGAHAESRGECVGCHVVGYRKPGGFHATEDAPRLANVQCESCHGMGTQHDATRPAAKLTETTCRQCHDETSSPTFAFAVYQPHIVHRKPSILPPLPDKPKSAMH